MNAQFLGLFTVLATGRLLAAYVGLNGWLPSAVQIASSPNREKLENFLANILDIHPYEIPVFQASGTAIFLAHTTNDEMIDIELGRQARDVLVDSMEYERVVWHEEQEGGHLGMLTTKGLDWIDGSLKSVIERIGEEMDCS